MADLGFIFLGLLVGAPMGMLALAIFSLPHLNKVEAENDRLRRLVNAVTEDVSS